MTQHQTPSPSPRPLTDPRLMRAVSHPVRLALLEALTISGPLTATEAGELIGETATTCSFHLRQLAKYGFVEEAGGGVGRARPWRVVQTGFSIQPAEGDPAGRIAGDTLAAIALDRQIARHRQSRAHAPELPDGWQDTASQNETVWWVTAEEFEQLQGEIHELIFRYAGRLADPALRPSGAMPVEFVALTHLFEAMVPAGALPADAPLTDAEGSQ